jgi:putative transposase
MAMSLKGAQLPQDIMLMGVRWSVAYPVSDRPVEELMEERGGRLDHATMQRGVVKYRAQMEAAFRHRKRPVGRSWHLDETDIRVTGEWRDLYRAVDTHGQTIDVRLTEHRETAAALRFLTHAIRRHGVPETMTIDGSEAHAAAIRGDNAAHGTAIIIRQITYLNHVVEPDHRAVKRVTRPMRGFKAGEAAQNTLAGIELMHMLKKRQLMVEEGDEGLTAAAQFYALAASSPHQQGELASHRLHTKICDRAGKTNIQFNP